MQQQKIRATWKRIIPSENLQPLGFLLCSFAVHAIMFNAIWQIAPIQYGSASGRAADTKPVTVRLLGNINDIDLVPRQSTVDPAPQPLVEASSVPSAMLYSPKAPDTRSATESEASPLPEYLPAGQLTRLPAPAYHIDLNITELALLPYQGKMELTLLIDASGAIANVLYSADGSEASAFAELVAQRFRSARFIPGEVNGKPVHSQIKVTAVSENIPAPGAPAHVGDKRPAPDDNVEIR